MKKTKRNLAVMTYRDKFSQYLKDLASKSPVPGGGSAASLVFCLGVSLIEMAINFSMGKNKTTLKDTVLRLEKVKSKVLDYVDLDGAIFNKALKAKDPRKKKKILKDLEKITFDLGNNCIKILMITKAARTFIKKSILSDFDIGQACLKLTILACIKNLEANSNIFGVWDKKRINYLKGYLKKFSK